MKADRVEFQSRGPKFGLLSTVAIPVRESGAVVTVTTQVQPCTRDAAQRMADEAGVSRRMIFLALKVKRAGCAEMHRMLRDGPLSMNLAAELVELFPNHVDQRAVLAEFPTLPVKQWRGFAIRVAALVANDPKFAGKRPQICGPIPPKVGPFAMHLPSHADGNCHEGRPC